MSRGLLSRFGPLVFLYLAGAIPTVVGAQQRPAVSALALVLTGVTVVDVDQGKLLPAQRVVILGHRIRAMGSVGAVSIPRGAHVVDARGKYLMPGLWDLHLHPHYSAPFLYPLLLANGVTGIRDAFSLVPLDTLRQWRREILAGTRVGPPRQLLSGVAISEVDERSSCTRAKRRGHTCVGLHDTADARHLVDSLRAAGVDMIKMYGLSKQMYFVIAAAARQAGLPFGGHLPDDLSALEAADSGAIILDHTMGGLDHLCWGPNGRGYGGSVAQCRPVAEGLRQHNTWQVPTLTWDFVRNDPGSGQRVALAPIAARVHQQSGAFWAGATLVGNWLRDSAVTAAVHPRVEVGADSLQFMHVIHQVGLPILAGTDAGGPDGWWTAPPGIALHAELAMYVAEGLTPLEALQSATLHPAQALHATDSLGTVAPGKLADLVLLDADPLADITNTTTIRAVIANGRYFDRAALGRTLAGVQTTVGRALRLPIDALAGHTVAVLPSGQVKLSVRAWLDSMVTAALITRAPSVRWVPPTVMRDLAGRLPLERAGKARKIESYSGMYSFALVPPNWFPRNMDDDFRQSVLPELDRLAAAASTETVLLVHGARFTTDVDSHVVCAFLDAVLLDTRRGTVLWQNNFQGYGNTTAAALTTVLAAMLPLHDRPAMPRKSGKEP